MLAEVSLIRSVVAESDPTVPVVTDTRLATDEVSYDGGAAVGGGSQ